MLDAPARPTMGRGVTSRASQRRKRGSGVPEVYDFRQPMTLTREHGRALEMALQTFAQAVGHAAGFSPWRAHRP